MPETRIVEVPVETGYDAVVEQLGQERFWGRLSIEFKEGKVTRIALRSTFKRVGDLLTKRS